MNKNKIKEGEILQISDLYDDFCIKIRLCQPKLKNTKKL